MPTDYDAPRRSVLDDLGDDTVSALRTRDVRAAPTDVDDDADTPDENFELPGADLSGEELRVRVVPKQADEFTCVRCFLVHHRSRLAEDTDGAPVCRDCA
ncbi:MAG: DUF4193 domain-containing protein [Sciscionella sp.]